MDNRQLQSFLAVARLRSFSRAGQELHLTQPAVSRHIKKLEAELALNLFERRRPVVLSPAGEKLAAYAEEAAVRLDRVMSELKRNAPGVEGKLRIAASTTPGEFIVPGLVSEFTAVNKAVRPEIVIADSTEVLSKMKSRQADVGFVGLVPKDSGLEYLELAEDEVVLAVPAGHPFSQRGHVRLDELKGQAFLEREGGSGTFRVFRDAVMKRGYQLPDYRVAMVLSNTQAIISAVQNGYGIGLVSSLALSQRGPAQSVVAVRFHDLPLRRRLFVVFDKSRRLSPVGAAFVTWVKQSLPRNADVGSDRPFFGGDEASGQASVALTRSANRSDPVPADEAPQRRRVVVRGIVQGVGFRPYVFNLASKHSLTGFVRNDAGGVTIEIEGPPGLLDSFEADLSTSPPPLAVIDHVDVVLLQPTGDQEFKILESASSAERTALISPDVATCGECLHEINDPTARRYRYAFTNCTNCGPRFTITKDVPYDRPNTTMAGFQMCIDCEREYHDPGDRRFHAQPIACPRCGPQLKLTDSNKGPIEGDPLVEAAGRLADGLILAVKGLGGYHLACDATNEKAVGALRARKHREDKPFALMAAGLDHVKGYCKVDEQESLLLSGHRRPVTLLARRSKRRPDGEPGGAAELATSVAGNNRYLGFMLPYTPLHHLLLGEVARISGKPAVLVMTSGNVSDEPIAYTDDAAYEDLKAIADSFLIHDRPIHIRCDDSVTRVFSGGEYPIRRARGYAPEPLPLSLKAAKPVLAVGAELKHTFCLAKQDRAFVSHHIGDLENWETMRSFLQGIEHFSRVFEIRPEVVAYDLHPEYLSTKWALEQVSAHADPVGGVDLAGAQVVGVQHHHAHIAACLADNHVDGPAIGIALDGTGWGEDGTIWGGEIMVADCASYRRVAHLRTVPLPGGAAAIKEPWRMAAVYLDQAFGLEAAELPIEFVRKNRQRWRPVLDMAARGLNSIPTSSAGRLFDALAAVCGLRQRVNYEGQAAIELEQLADPSESAFYFCEVAREESSSGEGQKMIVLDGVGLLREAAIDLSSGASARKVSAAFHNGLADALARACVQVRNETSISKVALSGGTFQNQLLLARVTKNLVNLGFTVYRHQGVPANDAGISFGQTAVATARMALN